MAADHETPPSESARPSSRRLRRRLLASALGLLLAGASAELGVRVVWSSFTARVPDGVHPENPLLTGAPLGEALREEALDSPTRWLARTGRVAGDDLFRPDRARGYRLIPGAQIEKLVNDGSGRRVTVTVDAQGLRGRQREDPPHDALRVLVIGDSMTFGEGVGDADTYPAQLEALLADQLGRPVRVYNAGIGWVGQQEELATLSALAPRIEPHVVLLQFTVANDVIDNQRWLDQEGPLQERPGGARELAEHPLLANALSRWSRAYRLLAWRLGRHVVRYRVLKHGPYLDWSAELLTRAQERAGESAFGVLIAPTVAQVEGSLGDTLLGTLDINEGLARRLQERGVAWLHPLAELRRAHELEPAYIPVDRHWSPAGHRAVAEALVPFLQDMLQGRGQR